MTLPPYKAAVGVCSIRATGHNTVVQPGTNRKAGLSTDS